MRILNSHLPDFFYWVIVVLLFLLLRPNFTLAQGDVSPLDPTYQKYLKNNLELNNPDDSLDEDEDYLSKKKNAKNKVVYRWPKQEGFKRFFVEVYKDKRLSDLYLEKYVNKNFIELDVTQDLYIRIALVSSEGELSDFSNLSKITYNKQKIALVSPKNGERVHSDDTDGNTEGVEFKWDYIGNGTCSLSIKAKGKQEQQFPLNGNSIIKNLEHGNYLWNISCSRGEATETTEERILRVGPSQTIKLAWDRVKKAKAYRVLLYYKNKKSKRRKKLGLYSSVKELKKLPKGASLENLYARLKVFRSETVSNWSEETEVKKENLNVSDEIRIVFSWKKMRFKDKKGKYSLSAFYSVSAGTFDETGVGGNKLVQTQNSPVTLGLAGLRRFSNNRSLSGSIYFSYLTAAKVKGQGGTQTAPLEIGLTAYYNVPTNWGFSYYYGLDLERFSTFNTDEISPANLNLEFREQRLLYLSGGITKGFKIFSRNAFLKLSGSYSLLSFGDANALNGENYTGYKYILYFNTQLFGSFSFHSFIKQHFLSNAGEQTVTRYGLGLGYSFF